jgi:alkylation response protein AidB-like acyl-CoA dehydrogenase
MGHVDNTKATETPEEHAMLRDSAIAFCERDASVSRLKSLKQSDSDFDPAVWRSMIEMGWSAILVPEESDGLGLSLAAAAVVVEELGRVVAPEPMIEVAGHAVTLLKQLPNGEQRQLLLRKTVTGGGG